MSNAVVGWQYVGAWASVAVAVALIAVVVSVWFSTKTLRRALNQFEQRRVDARTDKLRSEIIDLITALSERPSPSDAIINRIAALAKQNRSGPSLGLDGSDNHRDESRCFRGSFGHLSADIWSRHRYHDAH